MKLISLNAWPKIRKYSIHTSRYKVDRPIVGPVKSPSGKTIFNPKIMTNLFAISFSAVYSTLTPDNHSPHQTSCTIIPPLVFTINDVLNALNSLTPSSSMSPDDLHPYLLKFCLTIIAFPLLKIICH